jgi:glycosyltransferase involved in cell wall biosynthesis
VKVLSVHNYYRQSGGEDVVAKQECEILREHGDEVIEYRRSNSELGDDLGSKILFAGRAFWSWKSEREIEALILRTRPDVAHFHNAFPQISPSAYRACKRLGVPVVQTVHNYRMTCVRGDYFRNDRTCQDCLTWKSPLPAILHRCYRGSFSQTVGAATALTFHKILHTWTRFVDVFVALTEFGRMKLLEGGFPAQKIVVKPNFVHPDPGMRDFGIGEDYALFAGRLSPEKRVHTLVEAWSKIEGIRLIIVGSGPGEAPLRQIVGRGHLRNVQLITTQPRSELLQLMKHAKFLLVPSEWYETFGMVIIEAFACGIPVFASRLGAMAEIIEDGKTGRLFTPGSVDEIRECVGWAAEHPEELARMGMDARKVFEERYTAEVNYPLLIQVYEKAMLARYQDIVGGEAPPSAIDAAS